MKPSDYLRKGWTQGACARNIKRAPVDPQSPEAVSWCPVGAVLAAYGSTDKADEVVDALGASLARCIMVSAQGLGTTPVWNDARERTQEEAIAALEAIGE